MNRDFKGIWIPKEIWLNKELTLLEKCFIVEIHSLDNENGCFASNSYFSEFFNLKNTRVSQVINSLIKKGFIEARYDRKGKEVVKRVLTIKCNTLFNKLYEPIAKSVRTPLIYCKDNNTVNNTNNNNNNKPSLEQFLEYGKTVCEELGKNPDLYIYGMTTKFESWKDADWVNGKGNKIKNWKITLRNTIPYITERKIRTQTNNDSW